MPLKYKFFENDFYIILFLNWCCLSVAVFFSFAPAQVVQMTCLCGIFFRMQVKPSASFLFPLRSCFSFMIFVFNLFLLSGPPHHFLMARPLCLCKVYSLIFLKKWDFWHPDVAKRGLGLGAISFHIIARELFFYF